jgi:hypothetical protein
MLFKEIIAVYSENTKPLNTEYSVKDGSKITTRL